MPKQKTHSGAKKRFRVTRNGKVVMRQKNRAHLLEHKGGGRKRRLDGYTTIDNSRQRTKIKRLLKQ